MPGAQSCDLVRRTACLKFAKVRYFNCDKSRFLSFLSLTSVLHLSVTVRAAPGDPAKNELGIHLVWVYSYVTCSFSNV